MSSADTVRVVLADDHPVVRDGLRALLASLPGVEVVGEAATGRDAVREAVLHHPDVLVMDLQMPDLNGIDATREVGRAAPDVGVLVLTMYDDDDSVFAAMRAGARGYLLKGADQDEIVRAIHAVAGGQAIFGPGVAVRVLGYFSAPPRVDAPFPELTDREREVLDLIAGGLTNTAIARRLGLAGKTVGNHISNIFAKLQVAGRAEAIVRARREGLGAEPTTQRWNGT
jgi:DNA-binding NarL/FixJ family response regulator